MVSCYNLLRIYPDVQSDFDDSKDEDEEEEDDIYIRKKANDFVYIGNWPRVKCNYKTIKAFFSKYGRVEKIKIPSFRDKTIRYRKRHQRYIFVKYKYQDSIEELRKANKKLPNKEQLNIEIAKGNFLDTIHKYDDNKLRVSPRDDTDPPEDDLNINHLPDELFFVIFDFMHLMKVVRIGEVCKRWKRLSDGYCNQIKHFPFNEAFENSTRALHYERWMSYAYVCSKFRNITNLNITSRGQPISMKIFKTAALYLQNLRLVEFRNVNIHSSSMKVLSQGCPKIIACSFIQCSIKNRALYSLVRNCKDLESLYFERTRTSLRCIQFASKTLRRLHLDQIEGDAMLKLVKAHLNLADFKVNIKCPTDFDCIMRLNPERMEKLSIHFDRNVQREEYLSRKIGSFKVFNKLTRLKISGFYLTDNEMRSLLPGLPKLEELEIEKADELTRDFVERLVKYCRNLKCLRIHSNHLDDHDLRPLSQLSLREVFFDSIDFTEKGIINLSKISTLRRLNLNGTSTDKIVNCLEDIWHIVRQDSRKDFIIFHKPMNEICFNHASYDQFFAEYVFLNKFNITRCTDNWAWDEDIDIDDLEGGIRGFAAFLRQGPDAFFHDYFDLIDDDDEDYDDSDEDDDDTFDEDDFDDYASNDFRNYSYEYRYEYEYEF